MRIQDIFLSIFGFGSIVFLILFIPWAANQSEKEDYDLHKIYIGQTFVLNKDTIQVMEWRTGRYNETRGYVLSNGMTVDEAIVKQNLK